MKILGIFIILLSANFLQAQQQQQPIENDSPTLLQPIAGLNSPMFFPLQDGRKIGVAALAMPASEKIIPFKIIDNSCSSFYDGFIERGKKLSMGCRLESPVIQMVVAPIWIGEGPDFTPGRLVRNKNDGKPFLFPTKDTVSSLVFSGTLDEESLSRENNPHLKFFVEELMRFVSQNTPSRLACNDYRWMPNNSQKNEPVITDIIRWSQDVSGFNLELNKNEILQNSNIYGVELRRIKGLSGLAIHFRAADSDYAQIESFIPNQGNGQLAMVKNKTETCYTTIKRGEDLSAILESAGLKFNLENLPRLPLFFTGKAESKIEDFEKFLKTTNPADLQ